VKVSRERRVGGPRAVRPSRRAQEPAPAPEPEKARVPEPVAASAPAVTEGAALDAEPLAAWCGCVGDLVVYPGQGVAKVEEFGTKQIGGANCEFLVLRMASGASRIMIPVGKIRDVGLRPLMGLEEAERIWKILRTRPQGRQGRQTWIRQFREYQDRIKTGSVFDIAEVLRNLLLLQREKELSFGEHRVLDSARTLLAEELAAVERRSVEDVLAEIKQLARA
jgi:CarD family transcriptional regulator